MSSPESFSAELIRSAASAYAALAARNLLEQHPELGESMGEAPFQTWKEHLEVRLLELSAALEEGRSATFTAQVHWSRAAWAARGADTNGLKTAIQMLGDLLREELPPAASPCAAAYIDEALAGFDSLPEPAHFITGETTNNRLAAEYLQHLFRGEAAEAEALVLRSVSDGSLSVRDAYLEVLQPALQEIGLMWQLGEATVPDEHFATGVTRRLAARLSSGVNPPAPNGRTVLATSVAKETHDVGLQMVSECFVMDGWRVVNMGGDVPASDILLAVKQYEADVVAISATIPTHRRAVAETIRLIRASLGTESCPKVLVGGLAFPDEDSWQEVGADAQASDAPTAVSCARAMLGMDEALAN